MTSVTEANVISYTKENTSRAVTVCVESTLMLARPLTANESAIKLFRSQCRVATYATIRTAANNQQTCCNVLNLRSTVRCPAYDARNGASATTRPRRFRDFEAFLKMRDASLSRSCCAATRPRPRVQTSRT